MDWISDGVEKIESRAQPAAPVTYQMEVMTVYEQGDRIQARAFRCDTYYPGKVTKVNEGKHLGTYDIAYDDGDVEEKVNKLINFNFKIHQRW